MSSILHKIGCILVYDQQCMLNNNNSLLYVNNGAPSSFHNDDETITRTTSIDIHYFNTILNYTILILNIIMVVCLSNVVDWYATTNRMIELHQQQKQKQKEKRLQQSIASSSSVDDIDIRRPSNLAILVCFGFGKCTCLLMTHLMCTHICLNSHLHLSLLHHYHNSIRLHRHTIRRVW